MEPLKPQKIKELVRASGASEEDVAEYQRLLAERFATDPSVMAAPKYKELYQPTESRIRQLYQKIFRKKEAISEKHSETD